jgi:hypothetical protein
MRSIQRLAAGAALLAAAGSCHYQKRWHAVPWSRVETDSIYLPNDGVGAWAVVGSLSTVSHGFFLVFSFPLWLLVGGLSANSAAETKVKLSPKDGAAACLKVAPYTRFPGGLPAAMHARFE